MINKKINLFIDIFYHLSTKKIYFTLNLFKKLNFMFKEIFSSLK